MARLLPFLLVASLVVIAASAFDDEQEDSLDVIMVNEALADPVAYPEAKKGKGRKRKNKKVNKGGKKMKNKGNKKRKNSRCGTGRAAAQCGVDAVEALKFEGSVVDNFITQKKRALNFKGLVDKKKEKKANFANATDNMLDALGGNAMAPVCSMTSMRMSRASSAEAIANYDTLKNCTTTIESDCGIANGTVDEAALEACNETMFAIKTKNKECCAVEDAEAKCTCFAEAAKLVAAAKAGDCKAKGVAANKAMKAQKSKCTKAFGACNKAEAMASGLINICLGGEDMSATTAATGTTAASRNIGRW